MATKQGAVGATPVRRFRNTASLIDHSSAHFAAAQQRGLMSVYCRSTAGRTIEIARHMRAGKTVVDFVRCSYLGLDNHPAVIEGAIEAVRAYGSLHWSCARTRLNFGSIGDLEDALSDLVTARVITYSTVMVANMGALPIIASGHLTGGQKPVMAFDRLAHASLAFHKPVVSQDAEVETIPHNDLDALESLCRRHSSVAYVCDGVYSMGGYAPVKDLLRLQDRYGLFLYIDDAHGISVFGNNGEGFARSQIPGELGDRTIIAASLGKGFGASGGMLMLGTEQQEFLLRSYSLPHAFSASPNLAAIGAALASAKIHRSDEIGKLQQELAERITYFDERVVTAQRGAPLPIRMILVGDEFATIDAAEDLLDQGLYTSATFFPTVARGAGSIRICLTAKHEFSDLEKLCGLVSRSDRLAKSAA